MSNSFEARRFRKFLSQPTRRVDLEILRDECIEAFGGPRMFAQELRRTYDENAKSPMVRQKILFMIQQLVHATTVHGLGKPVEVSELPDDALMERLATLVRSVPDEPTEEIEAADDSAPGASAG